MDPYCQSTKIATDAQTDGQTHTKIDRHAHRYIGEIDSLTDTEIAKRHAERLQIDATQSLCRYLPASREP